MEMAYRQFSSSSASGSSHLTSTSTIVSETSRATCPSLPPPRDDPGLQAEVNALLGDDDDDERPSSVILPMFLEEWLDPNSQQPCATGLPLLGGPPQDHLSPAVAATGVAYQRCLSADERVGDTTVDFRCFTEHTTHHPGRQQRASLTAQATDVLRRLWIALDQSCGAPPSSIKRGASDPPASGSVVDQLLDAAIHEARDLPPSAVSAAPGSSRSKGVVPPPTFVVRHVRRVPSTRAYMSTQQWERRTVPIVRLHHLNDDLGVTSRSRAANKIGEARMVATPTAVQPNSIEEPRSSCVASSVSTWVPFTETDSLRLELAFAARFAMLSGSGFSDFDCMLDRVNRFYDPLTLLLENLHVPASLLSRHAREVAENDSFRGISSCARSREDMLCLIAQSPRAQSLLDYCISRHVSCPPLTLATYRFVFDGNPRSTDIATLAAPVLTDQSRRPTQSAVSTTTSVVVHPHHFDNADSDGERKGEDVRAAAIPKTPSIGHRCSNVAASVATPSNLISGIPMVTSRKTSASPIMRAEPSNGKETTPRWSSSPTLSTSSTATYDECGGIDDASAGGLLRAVAPATRGIFLTSAATVSQDGHSDPAVSRAVVDRHMQLRVCQRQDIMPSGFQAIRRVDTDPLNFMYLECATNGVRAELRRRNAPPTTMVGVVASRDGGPLWRNPTARSANGGDDRHPVPPSYVDIQSSLVGVGDHEAVGDTDDMLRRNDDEEDPFVWEKLSFPDRTWLPLSVDDCAHLDKGYAAHQQAVADARPPPPQLGLAATTSTFRRVVANVLAKLRRRAPTSVMIYVASPNAADVFSALALDEPCVSPSVVDGQVAASAAMSSSSSWSPPRAVRYKVDFITMTQCKMPPEAVGGDGPTSNSVAGFSATVKRRPNDPLSASDAVVVLATNAAAAGPRGGGGDGVATKLERPLPPHRLPPPLPPFPQGSHWQRDEPLLTAPVDVRHFIAQLLTSRKQLAKGLWSPLAAPTSVAPPPHHRSVTPLSAGRARSGSYQVASTVEHLRRVRVSMRARHIGPQDPNYRVTMEIHRARFLLGCSEEQQVAVGSIINIGSNKVCACCGETPADSVLSHCWNCAQRCCRTCLPGAGGVAECVLVGDVGVANGTDGRLAVCRRCRVFAELLSASL